MLAKVILRTGTVGSRCVRRIAQLTVATPNAHLVLSSPVVQQQRNVSVFAPSTFTSLSTKTNSLLSVVDPSAMGKRTLQTKGDKELVDFLQDEISAEKKNHKKLPDLSPFQASFNDAEVTLKRQFNDETITIKFNINNSVDTQDLGEEEFDSQESMVSKPNFSIEIERGDQVISLACSFAEPGYPQDPQQQQQQQQEDEKYDDVFTINELSVYKGDFSETTYSTSGDILDGSLYDLLISMLEDRGITNDLVDKISDFSTIYEHQRYVGLLETLQKFFK